MNEQLVTLQDSELDQVAGGLGGIGVVPSPALLPAYLWELAQGHFNGNNLAGTGLFGWGFWGIL